MKPLFLDSNRQRRYLFLQMNSAVVLCKDVTVILEKYCCPQSDLYFHSLTLPHFFIYYFHFTHSFQLLICFHCKLLNHFACYFIPTIASTILLHTTLVPKWIKAFPTSFRCFFYCSSVKTINALADSLLDVSGCT